MARKKQNESGDEQVVDLRFPEATRKNIPPVGLEARGKVVKEKKLAYDYNPHLPPVLRFDADGAADKLPELLEEAGKRPLTADEQKMLADALRNHQPWLEWTGKREQQACVVDPVGLHIHERVSAKAILATAARQDIPRSLFADPEQEYREAVQFYQHDVDWSNRLILGDSLSVMASLARREALAGKVQMIYLDPPYGIKYASNFQSEVGNRDVKEKPEDLTREPEMVKAYRDTWTLGIHSYLAYLRDRFLLCKELLHDSGSLFVQISDENMHRVRVVLDEVFGSENCFSVITVKRLSPLGTGGMANVSDYILWYAKDISQVKYRAIFDDKGVGSESRYDYVELQNGLRRKMLPAELSGESELPKGAYAFCPQGMLSSGYTVSCTYGFELYNRTIKANKKSWRTNLEGMGRVARSGRLTIQGELPYLVAFHEDNPLLSMTNI
jgi:adenine-specific DNA-methyltransferase